MDICRGCCAHMGILALWDTRCFSYWSCLCCSSHLGATPCWATLTVNRNKPIRAEHRARSPLYRHTAESCPGKLMSHCTKQADFGKEGDKHTTSVAGNHNAPKLGGRTARIPVLVFLSPRSGGKVTAPAVLCGSDSRSRTAKMKLSQLLWGRRGFASMDAAVRD